MIKRLREAIDNAEDHPRIKSILLKVAQLPESKQNDTLDLILVYCEGLRNEQQR